MKKGYLAALILAVLGALVIAGCGGGSDTTGESASAEGAENTSGGGLYGAAYGGGAASEEESGNSSEGGTTALVSTGKAGDLGQVIVDSEGMTLYYFHKDMGTKSACYGACESVWPPLATSGAPDVKGGAQASLLGTTERKDGTMQVTYANHPVYTYIEDSKPGEASGNDITEFGGEWYALQPNGEEPED
jgi:predicted lipoprotein with Yx(FWY)xxD motif